MQNFTGTTYDERTTSTVENGEGEFTQMEATRMSSVDYETTFKKATQMACFFNLANTIIGSGMLGLPYAYSASGWFVGSFLLLVCGSSSGFALHTLSLCALKIGTPASFYSVATKALPAFTLVIDAAVAIKCFGVATSYLIVIGDLMPDVMQQLGAPDVAQDRHLWVGLGFCIVVPLCLLRNIESLKFTSTMSICFVIFLTILIVLYSANLPGLDACEAVDDGESCVGDTTVATVDVHTFQVLSIFVFGFTCQQNIFAVTNEMDRPTPARINTVIFCAIGLAFCVYNIVAACGYKTYGSEVEPDILVNYPNNYLTSVARLFVSLLVCFTYPLQCHPSRRSILSLLHHLDNYRYGKSDHPVENTTNAENVVNPMSEHGHSSVTADHAPAPTTIHTINKAEYPLKPVALGHELTEDEQKIRYTYVTCGFLGLSLLIGMTVSNLGVVLALVGATGSTTVSYILPGFFYYIIFKEEGPVWKRNLALTQGIVGLILVPLCLSFIFV